MAVIGVDTQEIRSVAQRVQAGADDAESQRTMLLGQIQGLQGNWQGSASDALQELYQRWDQQARDLNDTLTQIAQQMNQAAEDYDTNESDVGRRFR
jgi:WXG100 family type VII secretion target